MSDLTFPQVFRNQNFEPVPTSHLTDTLLESDMAQKRAHGHSFFNPVLSMPMEATLRTELIHHQMKI